jgi:tetratricopeptide (TPR) repeat protein
MKEVWLKVYSDIQVLISNGYYEKAEELIKKVLEVEPDNNVFKEALESFKMYRDDYRYRSDDYNRRRGGGSSGCCCCCGDGCCNDCCTLWLLDSMCECCGGDLIPCC